jgi:predicted Abi (CAAX) family protease
MQVVMNPTGRKEQRLLALLKAPSKQPKTTTLQVRLEEHVRHNLDKYAEFLDANSSYVVSEGLKFLFRKDKEFQRWLGQHSNYPETQRHKRKEAVSKGESIQLQLK